MNRLPDSTHIGSITLLVHDLEMERRFYTEVLGFQDIASDKRQSVLGYFGIPFLTLKKDASLPFSDPRHAGLYHMAFLHESPSDLARTLNRVFKQSGTLYQGASDHLVSKAFYLTDPEGNGIELYHDIPRKDWTYVGGQLRMGTQALNVQGFMAEHLPKSSSGMISLGHVHLRVGDSQRAREFYCGTLGFDLIADLGSAVFASAGGYHHHIAANTWESEGAGRHAPELGLAEFTVILPNLLEVDRLGSRLVAADCDIQKAGNGFTIADPWGNRIVISA